MKRIVIASLALSLGCFAVGCSDSDPMCLNGACTTGTAGAGGAGGGPGTGGSGGAMDSGGSSGNIRTGACTEAGSVCATLKWPATTTAPVRLIAGFYLTPPPPLAPPDKTGDQYDAPIITPGGETPMKMLNVNVDGDYYLYVALYMPGGGGFIPAKGVDYQAYTTEKATLSKSGPTTLSKTLEFALAQ